MHGSTKYVKIELFRRRLKCCVSSKVIACGRCGSIIPVVNNRPHVCTLHWNIDNIAETSYIIYDWKLQDIPWLAKGRGSVLVSFMYVQGMTTSPLLLDFKAYFLAYFIPAFILYQCQLHWSARYTCKYYPWIHTIWFSGICRSSVTQEALCCVQVRITPNTPKLFCFWSFPRGSISG